MDRTKIAELLITLLTQPDTTPGASPAAHIGPPIGTMVVIRDHLDGVFWGRLTHLDLVAGTWALAGARQAHYWAGAAATPGLAARGPKGGRIGPACDRAGRSLISVTATTQESDAAWAAQPVWAP